MTRGGRHRHNRLKDTGRVTSDNPMSTMRFDQQHATRPPHQILPQDVIGKLWEALSTDEADLRDAAAIVESCPPLAEALLESVNRAAHGMLQPIASVRHAVAMLGVRKLRAFTARLSPRHPSLQATAATLDAEQRFFTPEQDGRTGTSHG